MIYQYSYQYPLISETAIPYFEPAGGRGDAAPARRAVHAVTTKVVTLLSMKPVSVQDANAVR